MLVAHGPLSDSRRLDFVSFAASFVKSQAARERGAGVGKGKRNGLAEPATWEAFAQRVATISAPNCPRCSANSSREGKRIIGYGASAKGNTC